MQGLGRGVQSSLLGLGHTSLGLRPLQPCHQPLSYPPAPACPTCRSGAGALPQPVPQMPRATACPDLPRELLGPVFLPSSPPWSLLLSQPLSDPLAPGSASPAPTLTPYRFVGTQVLQGPHGATGSGHGFHNPEVNGVQKDQPVGAGPP